MMEVIVVVEVVLVVDGTEVSPQYEYQSLYDKIFTTKIQ